MKTIIGSAIGVLAIGLVLIGAGLRGAATSNAAASVAPQSAVAAGASNVLPVADVSGATAGGPVMVNCAPGQRALVRQVALNGQAVSQVACVADPAAAFATDGYAAGSQAFRPVSYQSARTSDLTERRPVYQQAAPERVVREQRSWKKPLLVIGGSTAAGAGIGGIVGGKKGALIGAALGGGASTLYEATRK